MSQRNLSPQQLSHLEMAFQQALQLHQAGQLPQASKIYSQILQLDPKHANANHSQGLIALQTGHADQAEKFISKALKAKPDFVQAYNNLGITQKTLNKSTDAKRSFQKAIKLNPDYADAHANIGILLYEEESTEQALRHLKKAIKLNPKHTDALNALGSIHRSLRDYDKAIECFQKALSINSELAEVHNNLGNTYADLKQDSDAIACFQMALSLKPNYADAHSNLGHLFLGMGRLNESKACFEKARSLNPDNIDFLFNIGNVELRKGSYQAAAKIFQETLKLKPDYYAAHSNQLMLMNYSHEYSLEDIFTHHIKWEETAKKSLKKYKLLAQRKARQADQKIRIGYVSPDFRRHSVYYFFKPLLAHHNKEQFEVYCYYNNSVEDDATRDIESLADHFEKVDTLDDFSLAQRIHKDKIDILIDLTGHTAGNRLMTFLYKPAPIQVTWLGYPNTTGLSTIDYRITDEVSDPAPESENYHSEQLIRLPDGFLCYEGDKNIPLSNTAPCTTQNHITFGSFNNLSKVNDHVLKAWIEILKAVPDSKLLLKSTQLADPDMRARLMSQFTEAGIEHERLILKETTKTYEDHLAIYAGIDIALDPFPYNGTTTTFESLWMGVPVLTMEGDRHAGRVSTSINRTLGLDEFIADDTEHYISKAVQLSHDKSLLAEIRSTLRDRLADSPLCDAKSFALKMEQAFITMLNAD